MIGQAGVWVGALHCGSTPTWWPGGGAQQVRVTTSPVVFLSWLFRWSTEESELLSGEGRLLTQQTHPHHHHVLCSLVMSGDQVLVPGRTAQNSFGQAGFLQQL